MLDITTARNHYRDDIETIERLNELLRVLKTDGGHLTRAGVEFIHTGISRGFTQAQLARMLQISAASVSHHVNS